MSVADLMKKGSLRRFATATVATVATDRPPIPPSVARVATVSVATAQTQAVNDPAAVLHDPDRWAWPHSAAMTGAEIDTFTARLARFTDTGLSLEDAEALADKLVKRDRESDDRRLCLECSYLGAKGRCIAAATGRLPGASPMLEPVQTVLQRCEAFGLRKGLQ